MFKFLMPLLLLLLSCDLSWGFAQFDAVANSSSASASSLTFSHTNNGNIVYVFNKNLGATQASGVTYGGIAMNNFGDFQTANGYSSDVWYLSGNVPKGANNVIITYPGLTTDIVAISASYTGVGNGDAGNPPWNSSSGEDGWDGTCTGLTSPASTTCETITSLNYKNDMVIFAVCSLVTGTQPSTPTNGTNRLDFTGTTQRCDLFDITPGTTSGVSSTVGSGEWSSFWIYESPNQGYNRFLK